MDQWRPQNDRVDNRQGYHQTDFGEGNLYGIPVNEFCYQTRDGPNPRYPDPSRVAPYPSPARPYNPRAEQGLRQLWSSGSAYQRSPSALYPEQGSCSPSNHGSWSTPNAVDRYSYYNHQSSNLGAHTGPAMSGSTCFKQTVHGPPQTPQHWSQAPSVLPGNPNSYGSGQSWSQTNCSEVQNPQYDRPSHCVPFSKRIHETPRTSGSYSLPIGQGTAASPKGHSHIWNERPQRGMDQSRLIPENHTAVLRRPFDESHRYNTPGVPTVPVLEKSRSTPSRPMSKACRSPHSSKEDQVQEGDRTPKPRKPGKQRILTPAGRDHAKAIRQLPGGACADCKRKKTKARGSDDAV